MSNNQDYYETLGVTKSADEAEIKKSYRRLAMKHHPDRNKGNKSSEVEFKKITEAYEVLSDPQKKSQYDQVGHSAYAGGMGQQGQAGGFGDMGDMFNDIFGDIFNGGGNGRSRAQKGRDLAYNLELTLEQAVFGSEQKLSFPSVVSCNSCDSTGAKNGTAFSTCSTCGGAGQVHIQQGFLSMSQTCPSCRGSGKIIKERCRECHGNGSVKRNTTLSVKIPAGVDNGDKMRLTGKGEAGVNGGPNGDLYVQIRVKPHAIFQREGNDLICEVPVNFVVAALGGEIEVPTINKKVKLKIPAETQSGNTFRMRGQGVQATRNSRSGDLLCKIMVETPVKLNAKQKKALRDFAEMLNESNQSHLPRTTKWLSGIKQFFNSL